MFISLEKKSNFGDFVIKELERSATEIGMLAP